MTLEQLEQLAHAVKRRGPRWAYLLPGLRFAWTRMKGGEEAGELATRLAGALQLGKMPIATRCPKCPEPEPGTWAGTRTMLTLPDRYVSRCAKCETEWVTVDRKR